MKMLPVRQGLAAALFLTAMAAAGATEVSAASSAPYCGITWGSLPKAGGALSRSPLLGVRTGQHDCYDRVVFDFRGPATGFQAAYGSAFEQGRGGKLSVAGGATIAVVLLDPAYDIQTGAVTFPHNTGDHVADVRGFRTLREVVYGGSFEGYTTMAIGVRARLPFRVLSLSGPGGRSRLIVDVADRWSR